MHNTTKRRVGKSFLPARRVLSISQFSSSLVFSESHEKKKLVVFKKFFFIIFLINFPRFSKSREKGGKWSKVSAVRISSRCVHTIAESCRLSADTKKAWADFDVDFFPFHSTKVSRECFYRVGIFFRVLISRGNRNCVSPVRVAREERKTVQIASRNWCREARAINSASCQLSRVAESAIVK